MSRRGRKRKTIAPDFVNIDDNTCSICEAEFLDIEDLRVHFAQTHPPSAATLKCKFCPTSSPDIEGYLSHILKDHIDGLKVCKFCLRCFVNRAEFESHVAKHVCDGSGRFQCSQCSVYYHSMKELREHEGTHISNDGEVLHKYFSHLTSMVCMNASSFLSNLGFDKLTCVKCSFVTSDVKDYMAHLTMKKCKLCVCDKCNQGFVGKVGLVVHMNSCKKLHNSVVECSTCGNLIRKTALKSHRRACVIYNCMKCNIQFDTITEYTTHQLSHNPTSTMRLRNCRYCGVQIIGDRLYVNHMLKNHKDYHLYKYKCITCSKIFKHPKYLFSHYNSRHHKDLLPYSCKICNETFRNRKLFTIHIKMRHASVGFVEFDENFLVNFVEKRSTKPFQPPNAELFTEREKEGLAIFIQNNQMVDRLDERRPSTKKVNSIRNNAIPLSTIRRKRAKLNCILCKQGFYKQEQYYKHLSAHFANTSNKCHKCSTVFTSAEELDKHKGGCTTAAATSTLRKLLEKRKSGQRDEKTAAIPASEKFRATVKKVPMTADGAVASVVAAENKQSAKDFLENFTPESDTRSLVVIKRLQKPVAVKPPFIKMTRFTPTDYSTHTVRLKKPQRFKDDMSMKVLSVIKIHQGVSRPEPKLVFNATSTQDVYQLEEPPTVARFDASIPEVAAEIQLEDTEYKPTYTDLAKIEPDMYPNLLEIAHLQNEAPFYKIVPVTPKMGRNDIEAAGEDIQLPSGAKLVNTNPLAHLMGDKTLAQLTGKRKQKYKPRHNAAEALQKALINFSTVPVNRGYKKVKRTKVDAVEKEG